MTPRGPVGHVIVVVPARDEEDLLARCLTSVVAAASQLSGPTAHVVVVLDDCLDRTPDIARSFPVDVHEVAARSVGAARAYGVAVGLAAGAAPLSRTWIACTDADSEVPPHWLTSQLSRADAGADVVVGTVRPDPQDLTEDQLATWSATRVQGRPNGHVHGANLGVRADAYVRAGGFPHRPEHEDVELVRLLAQDARHVVVASDEADVLTSGRRYGRTPNGYAGYLRAAFG
ncbi:glycosyltransferase [Cellulomonas sp. P5_E12]